MSKIIKLRIPGDQLELVKKSCSRYNDPEYQKKYREKNRERLKEYDKNRDPIKRAEAEKLRRKINPEKHILSRTKTRAKKFGIKFNLELSDIVVPRFCPVLGIKLSRNYDGQIRDNLPSLDKFDPSKGYVKGNVRIISHRANTLKNNATVEELKMVIAYMEGKI